MTREDLDSAIESGDWAAVGATAALLAAASDSQSFSSKSRYTNTSSRNGSSVSSFDAARAAELDHLVDAGDWEGVVLAAAKFEASEETSTNGGGSKTGSSARSDNETTSSGRSPGTSISETPSKVARRDEIREEVEALVRRVVPEEIDNVDEMMLQFVGREEELVETLRTMQERQVAQKARVQGQKQAKRDARRAAQKGGFEVPQPDAAVAGMETDAAADGAGPPSAAASAVPVQASAATASSAAAPSTAASDAAGMSRAAAVSLGVGVAAATGAGVAAVSRSNNETKSPSKAGYDSSASEASGEESKFSGAAAAAAQTSAMISDDRSFGSKMSSSDYDTVESGQKRRTALELAIEAGDWEAVGEAAALMSDKSITSASSGEINVLASAKLDSSFSESTTSKKYKVNAERAAELDEMIDKGDWGGVVAAASRFSSKGENSDSQMSTTATDDIVHAASRGDSMYGSASSAASRATSDSSGSANTVEQERRRRIREEQEALAQAEIWMAIAEQSRQEGQTDRAASDAADWAIARSLSALKSAEQTGELEAMGSARSSEGDSPFEANDNSSGDKSV